MNRRAGIVLIGIGAIVLVSGCGSEDQQAGAADGGEAAAGPQFEIVNIDGDLYQAVVRGMGGHSTVFLVTPDGVILGDPISNEMSQWLKTEIAERFDAEVRYVLYSHHHPDHASGGGVFADTARFVGHANMIGHLQRLPSNFVSMDANGNGMIERSEASGPRLATFDRNDTNQDGALSAAEVNAHTYPPEVVFEDRYTVSLGGSSVEMHHTPPAHTDDMSVLLFPEHDVVFAVDFLQLSRLPGGASGFLAGYSVDNYETAINAVEELEFDRVIQGHSDIIGSRADVADFVTLLRTTEADVTAAIEAGSTLEQTVDSVMLTDYSDWLLYETRRPQLVGNMYEFLTQ